MALRAVYATSPITIVRCLFGLIFLTLQRSAAGALDLLPRRNVVVFRKALSELHRPMALSRPWCLAFHDSHHRSVPKGRTDGWHVCQPVGNFRPQPLEAVHCAYQPDRLAEGLTSQPHEVDRLLPVRHHAECANLGDVLQVQRGLPAPDPANNKCVPCKAYCRIDSRFHCCDNHERSRTAADQC